MKTKATKVNCNLPAKLSPGSCEHSNQVQCSKIVTLDILCHEIIFQVEKQIPGMSFSTILPNVTLFFLDLYNILIIQEIIDISLFPSLYNLKINVASSFTFYFLKKYSLLQLHFPCKCYNLVSYFRAGT